jgi:L-lysine 2,3-aminomutase
MKKSSNGREGIKATNKIATTRLNYSFSPSGSTIQPRFRVYTRRHIDEILQIQRLPESDRIAMKAVSAVFPFRVNNYVIDQLIDWSNIPDDPIYQLTFPQPEMLKIEDFQRMYTLVGSGASDDEIVAAAREIQQTLNPHPAGQMELNVPRLYGEPIWGLQHKYPETVLFFPAAGQTCHAYCTYCFRWPSSLASTSSNLPPVKQKA